MNKDAGTSNESRGLPLPKLHVICLFFQFTGCLANIFSFRFSNVLNLPESSTMLLSADRLHGKQDKPVGTKHMKHEEDEWEQSIRKSLTNPCYTGSLVKNFEFFLSSRKCLLGKRNL